MSEPTVLRAHDSADLLALAPLLLPAAPLERSVAALFFSGKRTYGGVRIGLPARRRTSDLRQVSRALVGYAARMSAVDGVAFVVYCDESFAGERGIPWWELSTELTTSAKKSGLRVVASLCVAADGWGDHLDSSTPIDGWSRDLIGSSPAALEAIVSHERQEPHLVEPAVTEDELDAFDAEVERMLDSGKPLAALTPWDAVSTVERRIAEGPGALDGRLAAQLVMLLQAPPRRDAAMLQVAFDEEAGRTVTASNERWEERRREHGGTMDEVVRQAIRAGDIDDGQWLSDVLGGAGSRRPDRARVIAGLAVLMKATSLAPPELQRPLLSIQAWLAWSIGRGSLAGATRDRLRDIDPDYGMLGVLDALAMQRPLPDWLFDAVPPTAAVPPALTQRTRSIGA